MTPAQLKLAWSIGRIVGTVLVIVAVWFGIKYVLDLRETNKAQAATIEQQNRTSEATSEVATQAGEATGARDAVNITLTDQRSGYNQAYQELKHENVTVAEFLNRPVPVELRELARQRCLARDGLGVGQAGRGCPDGGAADSGRPPAPAPSP